MDSGWDARPFLRDLLRRRKAEGLPHTQQWLADETGIQRGTINGYMADKKDDAGQPRLRLGMTNAPRIATALGVGVPEIGGPDEEDLTIEDRLGELAAGVRTLLAGQAALLQHFGVPVPEQATRGARR